MNHFRGDLATSVRDKGYAFSQDFPAELPIGDLISVLGNASDLGPRASVSELRPHRTQDQPLNTYSGNYGLGEFPLHTDMAQWHIPPRYILLRCMVGFAEVPTTLVDGLSLIGRLGAANLTRALVRPRRPMQGKLSLLRLLQPIDDGDHILRWDQKYIKAASVTGEQVLGSFRALLASTPNLHVPLRRSGDILLLDNWRMLHGRAQVPDHCRGRLIERAYLGSLYG